MKKLIPVLFYMLFVFPQIVFAYSPTTTHAGLTEQIVEFYNLTHPTNKISDIEKELIISGAVLEDTPSFRTLNHFYDPIRNIGINGGFTSKDWALDESIGLNEYAWQKSIDSYAIGDKEKAFIALGHTLHLIEDASVPDHTRNDPHMGEDTVTNASPFEDWTHLTKTRATLRGIARGFFDDGSQSLKKGGLGEYFDFVARYSNGNFFSRDSISNSVYKYVYPKIVEYDNSYGYGIDSITKNKFKLVLKEKIDNVTFKLSLGGLDSDTSVLSSYFDRLSKQAVLAGSGVVELFFRTANTARVDYLEQGRLKQQEEERRAVALAKELSSKGVFGLIWRGIGFLIVGNVITPVVKIARAGGTAMKGLGRTVVAGARNTKNVIVVGGFLVNTAGAIGLNTAKEKVGEISEEVRDGVSTVRTFVQTVLNREVVNGDGNSALAFGATDSGTNLNLNTEQNSNPNPQNLPISQDEITKLFEKLAEASEDLSNLESGILELNNNYNNDNPVIVVAQIDDTDRQGQTQQQIPKYSIRSYSAGFGGGGGGGTPTQQQSASSATQAQTQETTTTSESENNSNTETEESTSGDENSNDTENPPTPIPPPVITTPADFSIIFASTTISFSGTALASSTVEAVYLQSSATTTATSTTSLTNEWSMDLLFDVGTTTIFFTTIPEIGLRSSSTEITLNITLPEEVESLIPQIPDTPIVLSPTNGAISTSTTVLFSGTASSTNIISTDFSLATTTTDLDGSWDLTLTDFTQGTTTISFLATDTSGATSTATSTDIFIDSIAPDMGSVVVEECAYTISVDKETCLIPLLTLSASWSLRSGSDDFDYYELDLAGEISTTTATSTQVVILPEDITNPQNNLSYTIRVTAIDKAGNRSVRSGEIAEIALNPIIINEVAWAGTSATASDEWIELKNTTIHPVSLSRITLSTGDGSPNIEFTTTSTITHYGYYLIERKNGGEIDESTESPVIDVGADMWTSFGSGLKNSGEVLTLSYSPSDSSVSVPIIFDATPLVSDCGGWCGGSASPDYISMERINPYVSGADKDNWKSNNASVGNRNGLDVYDGIINGTPRAENSSIEEGDDGSEPPNFDFSSIGGVDIIIEI